MHRCHIASERIDVPRGASVAIKAILDEFQEEGLLGGDASLATVFPNDHLLPEYGIIWHSSGPAARTSLGIAALALAKARGERWVTIADKFLLGVLVFAQVFIPLGHRSVSVARVQR